MIFNDFYIFGFTVKLLAVYIVFGKCFLHPFNPATKSRLICAEHWSKSEEEIVQLTCIVKILKLRVHQNCAHDRSIWALALDRIWSWSTMSCFGSRWWGFWEFILIVLRWPSLRDRSISNLFLSKVLLYVFRINWLFVVFLKLKFLFFFCWSLLILWLCWYFFFWLNWWLFLTYCLLSFLFLRSTKDSWKYPSNSSLLILSWYILLLHLLSSHLLLLFSLYHLL